jgi:hypothetical protein
MSKCQHIWRLLASPHLLRPYTAVTSLVSKQRGPNAHKDPIALLDVIEVQASSARTTETTRRLRPPMSLWSSRVARRPQDKTHEHEPARW